MSQGAIVERYLRAHVTETKLAAERHSGPRPHPFITISREAGAGGTTLADRLVEIFAEEPDGAIFGTWEVFDRRLCEIVAKDPAYSRSLDALYAEEYPTKTHDFFRQVIGSTIDHGILMERVFDVVRAVAGIGKAVIIGRGGSEVTRGMPNGLSVRLVAPLEQRIHHLMKLEDLSRKKAASEVRRRDEHRARLLDSHFGVDIADPAQYDVTWNTGTCGVEEIARSIVTMLSHRVQARQPGAPA